MKTVYSHKYAEYLHNHLACVKVLSRQVHRKLVYEDLEMVEISILGCLRNITEQTEDRQAVTGVTVLNIRN